VEGKLSRFVLVRQNEGPQALVVRNPLKEPAFGICRAALLPALENHRPDAAGLTFLRLQRPMQIKLRAIELQRLDRAALGPDLQAPGRVIFEIITVPAAKFLLPLRHHRLCLEHHQDVRGRIRA
jgi:hypothetical protein